MEPINNSRYNGELVPIAPLFPKGRPSDLSSDVRPLIPFRIIKQLAVHCQKLFIKSALRSLGLLESNPARSSPEFTTSCFNTACAVLVLFLGKEKASFVINNVGMDHTAPLPIDVSGERVDCHVRCLVYGPILAQVNKDKNFVHLDEQEQWKRRMRYGDRQFEKVMKALQTLSIKMLTCGAQPCTAKDAVAQLMTNFSREYDFNRKVLRSLRKELAQNQASGCVDHCRSILYCIAAIRSEQPLLTGRQGGYEHIWVLEQFFCERKKDSRFRLYQSWLGESTLGEDLVRKSYGDSAEGAMDYSELLGFLGKIESLYGKRSPTMPPVSEKACFGLGLSEPSGTPQAYLSGNNLYGVSLRYMALPCDPGLSLQHLDDLIAQDTRILPYAYTAST